MQVVKHVVVTGASGYLGKHLMQSFFTNRSPLSSDKGNVIQYQIYALYGSHPDFDVSVQDYATSYEDDDKLCCQVKAFSLNLTDSNAVDAWLEKDLGHVDVVDVCIHLAAMSNPGKCQADPAMAFRTNVPKHFFTALLENRKCSSIIALSTDHVYPGTNPPYTDEDVPLDPINTYGRTKYDMERFLLSLSRDHDQKAPCRVILLRSSIILGSKGPIAVDHSKATFLHFVASRKDQETFFWTDEKRNVIWVNDVVAVIRWYVDNPGSSGGVYNMGGPQSVSRLDMAQAVFDYYGYDTTYLVAQEKGHGQAQNPNQGAPSPLDLTMDSSRLEQATNMKFSPLKDIVKSTFSS